MAFSTLLGFQPQRELAFGSIVAGYTAIGTAWMSPTRVFIIINATNALLQFSEDGVNDHFPVPANSQVTLDGSTNKADQDTPAFFPARRNFYVKRIGTPTSGSVYLVSVEGKGD